MRLRSPYCLSPIAQNTRKLSYRKDDRAMPNTGAPPINEKNMRILYSVQYELKFSLDYFINYFYLQKM